VDQGRAELKEQPRFRQLYFGIDRLHMDRKSSSSSVVHGHGWLKKNLRLTACHSEARSTPGFFVRFFLVDPCSVDMVIHGPWFVVL
jgi:hypothetical protein